MFSYDRNRARQAEELLRESDKAMMTAMDTVGEVCRNIDAKGASFFVLEKKLHMIQHGLYEDAASIRGLYRTLDQIDAAYEGLDHHLCDSCDRIPNMLRFIEYGRKIPYIRPRPHPFNGFIEEMIRRLEEMTYKKPDPSFWTWILLKK